MKRILFAHKEDWLKPIAAQLCPPDYDVAIADLHNPAVSPAGYDCVVPLRISDYRALRPLAAGQRNFLVPEKAAVDLAHDKLAFNRFLIARGFGAHVPELYEGAPRYPFVFKKRRDSTGRNSHIVATPAELASVEGGVEPGDYFRQEYTPGRNEYTTHLIAVAGAVHYVTSVEYVFDSDCYVRGAQARPKSVRKIETPFMDVFGAVAAALNYTGTCCLNYKIADGVPKLFELNPRPGFSLTRELAPYVEAYVGALSRAQ